jgi:hypothetical protein
MTVKIQRNGQGKYLAVTIDKYGNQNKYTLTPVVGVEKGIVPDDELTPTVRDALENKGYTIVDEDDTVEINSTMMMSSQTRHIDTIPEVIGVSPLERKGYQVQVATKGGAQRYVFKLIDAAGDEVNGEAPDDAMMYTGEAVSWRTEPTTEGDLDDDHLEMAVEALIEAYDVTVLFGVDGGWKTWEGRPEWSETYIDVRDANAVSMD